MKFTVIGIDLAKAHFQLHGNDAKGKRIFGKTMTPEKAIQFLSAQKKCIVAMEACAGAHYYGRKIEALGHEVRLIPPQYVRAYVIGNHNDVRDADAIAEAALSKRIRFVPLKKPEHQDLQNLHRIRQRLISNKVALSNQIRGILYEYGIRISKGDKNLRVKLVEILDNRNDLSAMLYEEISLLREEFIQLTERIKFQEKKLEKIARSDDDCKRLMTIPGVGPLISTAIKASISDPNAYKNGRQLAASFGLVPGHRHTGGPSKKVVMLGITKRGDNYIRKLLIQGARAFLISAKRYEKTHTKKFRDLSDKKGFNKASVAIAHKNARIIYAILTTKEEYQVAKAA